MVLHTPRLYFTEQLISSSCPSSIKRMSSRYSNTSIGSNYSCFRDRMWPFQGDDGNGSPCSCQWEELEIRFLCGQVSLVVLPALERNMRSAQKSFVLATFPIPTQVSRGTGYQASIVSLGRSIVGAGGKLNISVRFPQRNS